MTYMIPKAERNLSVLFCWSLGPDQPSVLRRVGMSSSLVSIQHFSKPFNDKPIFSIPKILTTGARLNQFCSSLSRNTSISLRLNSSGLLLALETFNKEDIFICSSFWPKIFVSGHQIQNYGLEHLLRGCRHTLLQITRVAVSMFCLSNLEPGHRLPCILLLQSVWI